MEGGVSVTDAPRRRIPAAEWLVPAATYFLFRLLGELIRLPASAPTWAGLVLFGLTAAGSIALPVWLMVGLIRTPRDIRTWLLIGGAGLILWAGLWRLGRWTPAMLLPLSHAAQDQAKVFAATGLGSLMAMALKEPNILLPAGIFAAFADFVVVHLGTVKHWMSTPQGQEMVASVSSRVPSMHQGLPQLGLSIGPADFLFLEAFLACAQRFDMNLRRTAIWLSAVLGVTLLLVPLLASVPALAPMSAAFILVNWRRFRLTRQEIASSLIVILAMGGLFVLYFLIAFRR